MSSFGSVPIRISNLLIMIWKRRVAIIFAACCFLFVVYILFGEKRPVFSDEQEYLRIANNLVADWVLGYDTNVPSAYRAPGYVIFITPAAALGLGKSGVVILQILVWGASLYLVGLISYRMRGPEAAALAVIFASLYPLCAITALTVYPQTLTAFLVLLFVWMLTKEKQICTRTSLSAGIIMGISILVSPILLLVFFGSLCCLPFFSRLNFRQIMIAMITACCVVAPWIGRNWIVMGTPSISTSVGINLIYSYSDNASPDLGTSADVEKYTDAVRDMGEVEKDRALRNLAIAWIRDNPTLAIKFYIQKILRFFGYKEMLKTQVAGVKIFQNVVAVAYYPLLFLGVFGVMYFAAGEIRYSNTIIVALYLLTAASHALFLERLRYRAEVDFLIVILAANFLATVISGKREREVIQGNQIVGS